MTTLPRLGPVAARAVRALPLAAGLASVTCMSGAQPARTTSVVGVVAAYADATPGGGGPAHLQKILGSVRAFYAEGSDGTHELRVRVHPTVLALPQARPQGKCQLPAPNALSQALHEAGVRLDGVHALALVVPASASGCRGGVATAFRHHDADGSSRVVPLAVSWSYTDRFVAHEILHTHGLGHAKALQCGGASLGARCTTKEYGNVWDVMGNGRFQMLSAPLRTRMGWTEPIVHTTGQATYTIGAATRPGGRATAVQVRLPFTGNDAIRVLQPLSLWVEYRAPFGFDVAMASPRFNFADGAMVNVTGSWQSTGRKGVHYVACPVHAPCLVDTTADSRTFYDAGLAVGRSWTEPLTGTRIEVTSRTETTLTVTVSVP